MVTLKRYSGDIRFMFMRVNAQIVDVRITRLSCFVHLPKDDKLKIFNELGISTKVVYVCVSPETAETLIGLLTTLEIKLTRSTGNY